VRTLRVLIVLVVWLVLSSPGFAQVRTVPSSHDPAYDQTIGVSFSAGPFLDKDAGFWGVAADWGKRLGDRWSGAASLAFDRENDRSGAEKKVTDTLRCRDRELAAVLVDPHHGAVEGVRERRPPGSHVEVRGRGLGDGNRGRNRVSGSLSHRP
jgi:hypothetical protein